MQANHKTISIVIWRASFRSVVAARFHYNVVAFSNEPMANRFDTAINPHPQLTKQLVKIHPYYSVYLKQIATARPRTPTPKWPQIDQVLQTEIPKAFKGDETVQQALDSAAKQIDALL